MNFFFKKSGKEILLDMLEEHIMLTWKKVILTKDYGNSDISSNHIHRSYVMFLILLVLGKRTYIYPQIIVLIQLCILINSPTHKFSFSKHDSVIFWKKPSPFFHKQENLPDQFAKDVLFLKQISLFFSSSLDYTQVMAYSLKWSINIYT